MPATRNAAPSTAPNDSIDTDITNVRPGVPYFPGIEGLRGLAVAGVLVFHGQWEIAKGGFLGVSTFFTLSGFLITSLLLREQNTTGTISLDAFWQHRVRRLLPASLACLCLVVVFGAVAADPSQRQKLFGDLLGALAYVANWRFVFSGESYADLFGTPSPVLHFWSLAIEEQFYVVFPIIVFVSLRLLKGNVRRFAVVMAVLLAASIAATVALRANPDRVYYGTDTRAAEVLVGVLLAIVLSGRLGRLADPDRTVARQALPFGAVLPWIGLAAAGLMLVLWSVTPQSAPWVHSGGLVGYAMLSALVIIAAMLPTGPVAWLLTRTPMRELGRISYGVYLYHWPIFLWLTRTNTSLNGFGLFAYHVAVTLGVAWLSARYLEGPIRTGRPLASFLPPVVTPPRLALGVMTVILLAGLAITRNAPAAANDFAAAQAKLAGGQPRAARPRGTNPAGQRVPKLAVFGDSVALTTGLGLGDVLTTQGRASPVPGATKLGCGLGLGGKRKSAGREEDVPAVCDDWPAVWRELITRERPDIAVVQVGPWDVNDRLVPGDTVWRKPGDPTYDAYLREQMRTAAAILHDRGATVVWLTSLPIGANAETSGQPETDLIAEPERFRRFNEILAEEAANHPDWWKVVDLATWLGATGEDDRIRADGVHLGDRESKEVAERYLADAVIRAYDGTN